MEDLEKTGPLGEDWSRIIRAIEGSRGPDQEQIARTGIQWIGLLLRKNADYGSSVWNAPVLVPDCDVRTAILVRMSDKIQRLISLQSKQAEVSDESFEDTLRDLGAYCLLELARPRGESQ